ncbi:MAG: HK97-gp10 family putative phage morphogenesis protein [Mizugakiibacter sp.]|uniref:HK97-gp10 family putative phage morphogenesis protein n=1 Tax=Mizugakiibacter sp. TaxID=1972610 RepID=UPI00320EDB9B
MKIKMDVRKFKEDLRATADMLNKATRPAAQAGAQIIYDRAKVLAPVAAAPHYFYGQNRRYGPFAPGNLRESIYQAFSQDNSFKDVSTYHISWNASKAPYGAMVEFGTSKAPARSFIAAAVAETRAEVRAAIKARFIEEVSGK